MQHAQTVKCSTPPSLCPTLVSFLIRKRTCSNAGTEQRPVGKTVVCILFWVSFVFSPNLVQIVFSFSI